MSGVKGNVEVGIAIACIGFVLVLAAMTYMTLKEKKEDRRVSGNAGEKGKNGTKESEKAGGWWWRRKSRPRKKEMTQVGDEQV